MTRSDRAKATILNLAEQARVQRLRNEPSTTPPKKVETKQQPTEDADEAEDAAALEAFTTE